MKHCLMGEEAAWLPGGSRENIAPYPLKTDVRNPYCNLALPYVDFGVWAREVLMYVSRCKPSGSSEHFSTIPQSPCPAQMYSSAAA